MDLPKKLTIIEEDFGGEYVDCLDCPLARALKRAGVPVNAGEGYLVSSDGEIVSGVHADHAGQYAWEDGTQFSSATLGTGTLVLKKNRWLVRETEDV